ncbi:MAG: hypothetical protein Q7R95_05575 [bacterium]|nr:hypothetical protein [bacterium]
MKIKPYIRSLLQENIAYLLSNVVLLILIIVFVIVNFTKIPQNKEKIANLQNDIKTYQAKLDSLNYVGLNNNELQKDIIFLNKLVPNVEDYFSIIYALENISTQTNFRIDSYSINLQQSTSNKLKLKISGTGDRTAFVNFLKLYNFAGGRLITADKFELNPQLEGSLKIEITLYNNDTSKDSSNISTPSKEAMNQIQQLRHKVEFSLQSASQEATIQNTNYLRKTNPFN